MSEMRQRKRERVRSTPQDVIDEIHRLAAQGWKPAEIDRHLSLHEKFRDRAPRSLKTVRDIAAEVTPRDESGDWSFARAHTSEAELVLPVLAAVVENTAGRVRRVSNREAEWIARMREAVSDIPLWWSYLFARRFLVAQERGESTAPLDEFLAFAPWREGSRYGDAYLLGWIEWLEGWARGEWPWGETAGHAFLSELDAARDSGDDEKFNETIQHLRRARA